MKSLKSWLDEYSESHQNQTNKKIHFIAVPAIYFTVVGLIWSIPIPTWLAETPIDNWVYLVMLPVMAFYFALSFTLGAGMAIFTAACLAIVYCYQLYGPTSVLVMSIAVFVVMWIAQFYGHKVEGKKPSFFKDLCFLLIGPAWIMHWLINFDEK